MKAWLWLLFAGMTLAAASPACNYETIEVTDVKTPPPTTDELTDDTLDSSQGPKFDEDLVHSRPIDGWQVNLSAAVIKLDVEMARPDYEEHLVTLYPSYAAAILGREVLPSVNLIDGKAKQFDDGLYAALDLAYYRGLAETLHSHVDLVRKIAERAGPDSPAAPFLAAALELAGVTIEVNDKSEQAQWWQQFERDLAQSKPIGFYTWNDDLRACFRFLRFLQQQVLLAPAGRGTPDGSAVMVAIAQVLQDDLRLRDDYAAAVAFYSRLSNPPRKGVHLLSEGPGPLQSLAGQRSAGPPAIAVFLPSSTSRENELFEKLFPMGLPQSANLMRELIQAVRSGDVDLTPREDSGWYDYQAYALETLLLPSRGEEAGKLLRTARYKRRMLEAFAALITKRRETHIREMAVTAAGGPPPAEIWPRLRIEPCPTYYMRTARAYAFLQAFLEERLGREQLANLHGLSAVGERPHDLAAELDQMRTLFYGLYLMSCEDLGLRPSTTAEETGDPAAAIEAAEQWLGDYKTDPDVAVDTRVIVPVYRDPRRQVTSVWAIAGVRLVKLTAEFDERFPPSLRPLAGGQWKPAEPGKLAPVTQLIAVDEFVTCQMPSLTPLTRDEFRKLCDEQKSKERIVAALEAPPR